MNKDELAEIFILDKADSIKSFIKEAFINGYEQGVLQASLCLNVDGTEFVDLGLSSRYGVLVLYGIAITDVS